MEKTRTPLKAWFRMMFLMANMKTGVSVLGASRLIGISYKRAWFMAQKIHSAMIERDDEYLLEGVVELDESYFGGKHPGKRGRGAAGKVPVLVGVTIRGVHHGVTPKNLQGYLSEFCWRYSRRNFNGELFDRLLWTCIRGKPLTWSVLSFTT